MLEEQNVINLTY